MPTDRSAAAACRARGAFLAVTAIALAAAGLAVALAAGGGAGRDDRGAAAAAVPAPRADRFDEARAWRWLVRQVRRGPRPAGSPAARRLAAELARALPAGRRVPVAGHPGLQNVVGRLPGRRPAVLLAAHYDTKALPGFVGANDGAGGTALVVEAARALARLRRPRGAPELRFALFDGEEATDDDDFYGTGLRGSKAYARTAGDGLRAVVVADFVADRDLRIPREETSDPALWRRLRAAARRAGAQRAFPAATQGGILDDHTPFQRRGVPAIDLIDFDFACWHRACDDLPAVSRRSLDASGETVVELLASWR